MPEDLFSTQAAAELIASVIHEAGGVGYWTRVLTNNRRDDRNPPHRIPFERIGTGAFYRREDLADFIEFEKSRRVGRMKLSGRAAEALRAVGFGEPGGSSTGRKFDCQIVAARDEASGEHFAQLIIRNPFMIFRLEPQQVRELSRELKDVADAIGRWSKA